MHKPNWRGTLMGRKPGFPSPPSPPRPAHPEPRKSPSPCRLEGQTHLTKERNILTQGGTLVWGRQSRKTVCWK